MFMKRRQGGGYIYMDHEALHLQVDLKKESNKILIKNTGETSSKKKTILDTRVYSIKETPWKQV